MAFSFTLNLTTTDHWETQVLTCWRDFPLKPMPTCNRLFPIQSHFGTLCPPLCVTVLLWFKHHLLTHLMISVWVFGYMHISYYYILAHMLNYCLTKKRLIKTIIYHEHTGLLHEQHVWTPNRCISHWLQLIILQWDNLHSGVVVLHHFRLPYICFLSACILCLCLSALTLIIPV